MDSRTQPATDRIYEDFEPYYEWDKDEGRFSVMLPGYTRNQLKVQVTSKPALRLMGERLIIANRWRRFSLEFPIPSDYDTDNVAASFEGGRLSIKFGKLDKPKEEAQKPIKEPSQKVDEQKPTQEDTPRAEEDKTEAKTNEVSEKTPQKEKKPIDGTEKGKAEIEASKERVNQGARTNGLTEKTETAMSKAPKAKQAKTVPRSKTRLIDFSLSGGPLNQIDNETPGDSASRVNKWKRLAKAVMLIILVAGIGLYIRNAFRSSHEEQSFQEL